MPNKVLIRRSARLLICVATLLAASLTAQAAFATSFYITGQGNGHGIGLSQYGAQGYAKDGWTYTDILRWYYGGDRDGSSSGVQVRTLSSLGKYSNPYVKVHLAKDAEPKSSWTLRGWQTRLRCVDDSGKVVFLSANSYHTFTLVGGKVSVGGVTYDGTLIVRPETTTTVSTPLIIVKDLSGGYGAAYVAYRGEIRLSAYSSKLRALNVLPLESYVKGVVPRESPSTWDMDALKAQAVAARCYAWAGGPPSSTSSSTLSSILKCTTYSQMYCGYGYLGGDGKFVDSSYTIDGTSYWYRSKGETERTNDAADATAGQVMYYSPAKEIFTTYFASSSGGHTADWEDVWVSMNPKPYYKGVVDNDSDGNSYYSWDRVTKTGTELAHMLGSGTEGLSAHGEVRSVSQEMGSYGYVRYVTFRFADGYSYRISGWSARSELGLPLSRFRIAPVDVWTTYQQSDAKIGYAGSWTTWRSSALSGGSYKYASRSSALAVFTFKGTGFRWITTKSGSGGYGDVYLDGVKASRVSLYSSTPKYRAIAWSKTGLSADTTHTIILHVTGKHASGSRGNNVGVDAVQVLNGSLRTAVRPSSPMLFDDTDSRIAYEGTWTTYSDPLLYNGSYQWARNDTDTATFKFIGTRLRLITSRGTNYGKAYVYLDAREPVLVDAYGDTLLFRQPVWDSGALSFGVHTVHVVPTTDKPFGIDRLDVWAGQLTP